MQIENKTAWKADHVRAIIEATAKVCGAEPPERISLRRSYDIRVWGGRGHPTLGIRLPQPDATPLEMIANNRFMRKVTYLSFLCELVECFLKPDPSITDYEEQSLDLITRRRAIFGVTTTNTDSLHYRVLQSNELASVALPAWAEALPLVAGEKGKGRQQERLETLRVQVSNAERDLARMVELHKREQEDQQALIEKLRDKVDGVEAKLNKPKRTGRKKQEVA